MLIAHHGYRFAVDGMEWRDSSSAEDAQKVLQDWLHGLDADETARLHADLLNFNFDPAGKPSELVEQAMEISAQAHAKAMDGLPGAIQSPQLSISANE